MSASVEEEEEEEEEEEGNIRRCKGIMVTILKILLQMQYKVPG
jgi:hypothetical protein